MKRRRHAPEQTIRKLWEADRLLAEGPEVPEVIKRLEVSEATYHRWRAQYGGMKADDAKRLKELEGENARLKRIVADKELQIQALKELNVVFALGDKTQDLQKPVGVVEPCAEERSRYRGRAASAGDQREGIDHPLEAVDPEAARLTGHTVVTLRHWEKLGLLDPAPRRGGKRRYPPSVLIRIAVIDLARRAGFGLAEIRDLLAGPDPCQQSAQHWRALPARKLGEIESVMACLRDRQQLLKMLSACQIREPEDCASRALPCTSAGRHGPRE